MLEDECIYILLVVKVINVGWAMKKKMTFILLPIPVLKQYTEVKHYLDLFPQGVQSRETCMYFSAASSLLGPATSVTSSWQNYSIMYHMTEL